MALDLRSHELDRPRTQESMHDHLSNNPRNESSEDNVPSTRIPKLPADRVQYCVQEDAILETNIDEHRRLTLVNTCVEHLSNANR